MSTLEKKITEKLIKAFEPIELTVMNESHKHKGHAGDNGSGESHFRIEMVSNVFKDKTRVDSQRMVYDVLSAELKNSIHALSLQLFSP